MSILKFPLVNQQIFNKENSVLLVIAHPDDEVMFFTPLLSLLSKQGNHVSVLCLSNGNFEGLGKIRTQELYQSCKLFHIDKEHIDIINHPQLQDGLNNNWDIDIIAEILLQNIKHSQPNIIVTFDERGVSNHPNHIATYHGVAKTLQSLLTTYTTTTKNNNNNLNNSNHSKNNKQQHIIGLKLISTNMFRKFSGVFDIILSYVYSEYMILHIYGLCIALQGMYIHRSQNQLYRQIFVIISSFTYINAFASIHV